MIHDQYFDLAHYKRKRWPILLFMKQQLLKPLKFLFFILFGNHYQTVLGSIKPLKEKTLIIDQV